MKTKLISVMENEIEEKKELLVEAGEVLKQGGLVAFPTETVYGLGGDALNPDSSRKIYAAKGRPSDNPLIVHIADMEALDKIVTGVSEETKELAAAFWPGPLTMVMKKADIVPDETSGGLQTVAVRMPSHKVARELIAHAGGYVAAPSANISGKPSPTVAKYVMEDMDGRIEMVIDGGEGDIGLESTIVDMTVSPPQILRPGFITEEMLTKVLGSVSIDKTILDHSCDEKPKAPGMKYRHYAPKGELSVVMGDETSVVTYINEKAREAMEKGIKVGVIGSEELVHKYQATVVKNIGSKTDEKAIARNLYLILRQFDEEEVEVIYSEGFHDTGVGQAIMNRLLKAAGHKVINVEKG